MTAPIPNPGEEFVSNLTAYQNRLYAYALTLLGDRTQAAEVMQETNLVLWRKSGQFTPGTDFLAWAYRVTSNQVLAYRQKLARDRLVLDDALVESLSQRLQRSTRDDGRQDALVECLGAMPQAQRELVRLRYSENASVQTLARQMGKSANAVSKVLHRARMSLLECVKQKLAAEGRA